MLYTDRRRNRRILKEECVLGIQELAVSRRSENRWLSFLPQKGGTI